MERHSTLLIIAEIQFKTSMRYHLILDRMAIIKMSTSNKSWRGCGEKGTLLHCWWECKLVQPLWKTVWRYLRKLYIEQPYTQPSHSWAYVQTKLSLKKTHAPTCSVHHSSKQPRHGNNPNVHPQTIGLGRCGIYT